MAKNIVPKNPQNPQKTPSPIEDRQKQARLLQIGLEFANCWPGPDQTTPPNGFNSDEMRSEIISILHRIPDRYILIVFNVAIHLYDPPTLPPLAPNGVQKPPGEKDRPLMLKIRNQAAHSEINQ